MIRPILFSGDMVRAILDGRKTETRRPVKPKKHMMWEKGKPWWSVATCPYGQPGDLLWVREPGRVTDVYLSDAGYAVDIRYAAGGGLTLELPERFWSDGKLPLWALKHRGIPNGIFREAARIFREITAVSVERLEDITEAGARAEGFNSRAVFLAGFRAMYKLVPYANPWVWVVGFKTAAVGNEAAQAVMRAAA